MFVGSSAWGFATGNTRTECRVYHIYVNKKLNILTKAIVIAHELKHVEQMILGKFKCCKGFCLWKTKKFSIPKLEKMEKTGHYDDIPWEKEALKFENKIYLLLLNNKIKWEYNA